MKTLLLFIANFLLISMGTFAQFAEGDSLLKKEMSKLSFMVGQWEGEGWMFGQDRVKHEFEQTENIQFKLDSTAILVEGRGLAGGEIVHDALAIVRFDKGDKNYNFYSFLPDGKEGIFKAELIEGKFHWYPIEQIRYIISINEKGQWYEKGEIMRDGKWIQFFEMTLNKQ